MSSAILEQDAVQNIAQALLTAAEAKDFRIRPHSERVARYCLEIAAKVGLDETAQHYLNLGALLHDIGNIGIPDSILLKPTGLTEWEFEEMKMHPLLGVQICKPLPSLAGALPLIRSHHEKLNGAGYPDGLKGDAIPLAARILAVVDVYDTLRCDRAYRSAFAHGDALEILQKEVEKGWWQNDIVAMLGELSAPQSDFAPV
jgi:putative two-component system response regulator